MTRSAGKGTGNVLRAWVTGGVVLVAGCALLFLPEAAGAWRGSGQASDLNSQSAEQVRAKSAGCQSCHTYAEAAGDAAADQPSMHVSSGVNAGCTDCHGGDAATMRPEGGEPGQAAFEEAKERAHVQPRLDIWETSANPVRTYAATLDESAEFIRFVNPGDLRVAAETCGPCHSTEVAAVKKSMMTHGGMLWGAAAYNNGAYPFKDTPFGEFYLRDGTPARVHSVPTPTEEETREEGILPFLQPLHRWELSQPGNVLRIFERGGKTPLEVGIPAIDEEPGRPRNRLSDRGLGTLNRTDPVFIGLQKTRLFDPTLNFMGTNDFPGDYRQGGCTACHVIYANDRSEIHSAGYADAGNTGESETSDPMIPNDESGHPIRHVMTTAIPTSQCMVCHMHPGTNMVTPYQGLTWWDNETDGDLMYPDESPEIGLEERAAIERRNPEGSAVRGLWSDPQFLRRTGTEEFNRQLDETVFADYHGHGWLYRAVFKRDRRGNLLDSQGELVREVTSQDLWDAVDYRATEDVPEPPPGAPVHLKDIHLERGMHCVDCHFQQDAHGNGQLYGEPRNAIEIACVDCHGTLDERATLRTSGPAAPPGGTDLTTTGRFQRLGPFVRQTSAMDPSVVWQIPQVVDSVTPGNANFNERAALAKTIQRDGSAWGDPAAADLLAHDYDDMTCQACHSSWITSCFGCHLAQRANEKRPMLHNEGTTTKNWTQYNYQVLRDDVYMLGVDGSVVGGKVSPVRSSSAVVVSSQDANRQWIYYQQQTVSAEGYSGQAFNTHVPHTVRTTETKFCTDCHVAAEGDNNAVMSQLLLLGTNLTNFMGRFVFVATGEGGVEAVAVTEMDEPQAVIGSDLHRIAYPAEYEEHQRRGRELETSIHHGSDNALDVQARGEYLYIADGEGGFRVFDIAQLNQKGFSEKIVTAPVSPLGQDTDVPTRFASAVAPPSTLALDPARTQLPENEEQPIHPMYAYIYVADAEEGLVLSTAATLLDGNPANNFLERAATFNPDGALDGAVNLAVAGHHVYVLCDQGLVVVDIDTPLAPRIVGRVGAPELVEPRAVAVQFRYAFVVDSEGLKVVDVTFPEEPRFVRGADVPLDDARSLYVARTYAYVAGGSQGLVIVDVERPEEPRVEQVFDADGAIDDARDVKVAMTNASVFAYVADGHNGLRVVQLVSSNTTPGAFGFSPRPTPELIATYHTHGPALAISEGLDRDRAVDETGNQLAVFGRRGGRPFNQEELRRMYVRDGELWNVRDEAPGPPVSGDSTPAAADRGQHGAPDGGRYGASGDGPATASSDGDPDTVSPGDGSAMRRPGATASGSLRAMAWISRWLGDWWER